MNYELIRAEKEDISRIIDYKLKNILKYAEKLSEEEKKKINQYVKNKIPEQINHYKIISSSGNKIGCLLLQNKDDGVLLDEIYLEKKYRKNGIGTDIIKKIISENNIIYLWVYQLNTKAISLYKKLGFKIIEESKTRYYMKYTN